MSDLLDELFNAKPTVTVDQQVITEWKPNAKKGPGQVYDAVIRFIPNPEDPSNKSIVSKNTVFLKNPFTNATMEVDCPSTVGQPDPLQDTFFALRNSENPILKENSKNFSRRQRYASLVQILSCKAEPNLVNKILIWRYGIKIHEKIYNEMNPPIGTPRNPFNMFTGRPFYVKVKIVSGFNNFDDSQFIDLAPADGGLRIAVKNAQGQETMQTITQEVVESNPNVKPLILNYLKENCPSLEPFEYHAWTPEITNHVNTCIKIYSNPQASMQAVSAASMQQANPYMQPAMQPHVMQAPSQVMPTMPTQPAAPTVPTSPMDGLSLGGDAAGMMQTTPGGFNPGSVPVPGLNDGDLDSVLNTQPKAPAAPANGISLDDVLSGIM